MHISFICTGNICRSPMARLVFIEHARTAGIAGRVTASSAGIQPWHVNEPADSRARAVLAEHNYPAEHLAKQIDRSHLTADLILAMDSGHLRILQGMVDEPTKVRLLRSFDPTALDQDLADPYHGEVGDFYETLRQIESAMPGLLQWVNNRIAERNA